ncbi:MAG TPA: RimK family alpha-L-glutamate ligase, partial [Aigarchaeota archaeon]|nr:RimK family alpha-L-glutamate ligase [Aigarchaeota archaeon]
CSAPPPRSKTTASRRTFPSSMLGVAGTMYWRLELSFSKPPPIGSWGRLIALIKDLSSFNTIIEHRDMIANKLMKTHVIQEYIDIPNRDIRTLVVGDEVLAAMFRYRRDGDWRTNVARGGVPVMAYLNEELKEISLKAAEAIGGEILSVDVFEMGDGTYLVNEINGCPEFKGFIQATGVDVASKIINYLLKTARG